VQLGPDGAGDVLGVVQVGVPVAGVGDDPAEQAEVLDLDGALDGVQRVGQLLAEERDLDVAVLA
jgi:hypothetical protein